MADDRDPSKQGEAGEFIGNPGDDAKQQRDEINEAEQALMEKKLREAAKEAEDPTSDTTKETEDALDFLRTK